MSGQGNTVGKVVGTPAPTVGPASQANPPVKLEGSAEKGWLARWWEKAKHDAGEAVEHPWEGGKGAVKGIMNIPSHLSEIVMRGATLQSAADMEQAAAMQSLFGQAKSADALTQTAQEVRAGAGSIELPKFKMSNAAQEGGDLISTGVQVAAGGAGLVKGGIRAVSAASKAGSLAETAAAASNTALTAEAAVVASETTKAADAARIAKEAAAGADAIGSTTKSERLIAQTAKAEAAKPAGDGAKVLERPKSKPKVRAKPRQPRSYEKKVVNEDGSITYTLKSKDGTLHEVTYRDGYPDFSNHKYDGNLGKNEVPIDMTGDNNIDFARANQAAGFGDKPYSHPEKHIWHHHQDGETMQLIKSGPHSAAPHTGGASASRAARAGK